MTIEKPGIEIIQNFSTTTSQTTQPLYPCIVGPIYKNLIYPEQKDDIELGSYDSTQDQSFPYPSQVGTVDESSIAIYAENAELEYLNKLKASGDYEFRIVDGYKNRIRTAGTTLNDQLVFKSYTDVNGNEHARSTEFEDRDVVVGDVVVIGDGTNETKTTITSIVQDRTASSVGSDTPYTSNKATQSNYVSNAVPIIAVGDDVFTTSGTYAGSLEDNVLEDIYTVMVTIAGGNPIAAVTPDAGVVDTLTVPAPFYDGTSAETYKVEVTTGGAPLTAELTVTELIGGTVFDPISFTAFGVNHTIGDKGTVIRIADTSGGGLLVEGDYWEVAITPSTGRLRITTQSGIDNVTSRVFPGFGTAFSIGTLGTMLSIADGGDVTLTANDSIRITTKKAIGAVAATTGGTYTGSSNITYIVEVTEGGVWGSCYVKGASNKSDSSSPVVVSAHSTAVSVGNYGATISFATNAQGGLVQGDKFYFDCTAETNGAYKTLVLNRNMSAIVLNGENATIGSLTANGGNTGGSTASMVGTFSEVNAQLSKIKIDTYTIEITKAGDINVAEYTVTTTSGEDNADAVVITDKTGATEFPIGQCGKKIKFTDANTFALGDKWTFTATKQNLNCSMRILKASAEIDRYREEDPSSDAWTPSTSTIAINQAILKSDLSWLEGTVPLELLAGDLYCQYKSFVPYTGEIDSVSSGAGQAEVESKLYDISKESYLGQAVYRCAQNNTQTVTKFLGLSTNNNAGWDAAIEKLKKVSNVYFIVPVSGERAIIEKFKAHVDAMSTSVQKKWRRTIVSLSVPATENILVSWTDDQEQEQDYTATVRENPESGLINYFEFADGQGVDLITSGVVSGYKIRYGYRTESEGEVFDIYTIDEIVNETTFTTEEELSAEVLVDSKIEVYKVLSHIDEKNYIKGYAGSIGDRRVHIVFPDEYEDGDGTEQYGFYAASGLSGVAASVEPQAPITGKQISGVSSVFKIFNEYTEDELDELANAGVLLLTQDTSSSIPYIRHQLSTDVSRTEYAEMSPGKNVDEISYYLLDQLSPYIRGYNITDGTIEAIRFIITKAIEFKKEYTDPLIGPQVISGVIDSIEQNSTQKTKLDIVVTYVVPAPLNNLSVTQNISL